MKNVDTSLEEELSTSNVNDWLESVYKSHKPFTTEIFHNELANVFTYSGRVTTLPDSEPTKYIISLNSITSHLEDEEHMREKLEHDELTGLNNYVKFEHLLGESQRMALKENTQLALIIVDIPELKEINKEQGMQFGDRAIINVSTIINSFIDKNMIAARLEGSRFGILTSYESEQKCYDWCSMLHIELSKKRARKTIALTGFDLGETINTLLMRAYSLIDALNSSEDGNISSDFKNIRYSELLPDQENFTNKLK